MNNQQDIDTDNLFDGYRTYLNPINAGFFERLGLDQTVKEAIGSVIIDCNNKKYIDLIAGYGIFNIGHNHQRLNQRLREEFSQNPAWNRPFLNQALIELAHHLVRVTPKGLDRVFICSTGAEAVESALKLVRLSKRKSEIIAAKGGFHGFTMGALSVSGIPQQTKLFQPLLPDISFVDYGDINAIHAVVSDKTAAIVLEPVQAEIGGIAPPKNYLREVREICDRHDVLLVVDEVRTGIGRTGPLFCIEDEQVVPDILAMGKSLAGGIVPIGAIIAKQEIWSRFGYSFSMSASSFAGNRLACIAAIGTLNLIEAENILNSGVENARILWNICNDIQRENEDILERITGKGMLLGLHFTSPKIANEIVRKSIMRGVLIGTAFCNNRCILLEPPLNISGDNLVMALETLKSVVQDKR